jgi:hypothetical protein
MDLTGAILLAGIALVIGFLVGMLVFSFRKESDPEGASRERVLSDAEHAIRVWREGKERRLVVEIGGVSHYRGSELHADQNQVVADLITELQAWMNPLPKPAEPPEVEPLEREPMEVETEAIREETPGTSLNPLKIFGRSLQPLEKTSSDASDLSIVAQIDEILQEKLEGTELEDKGIRLIEGSDQSMVIQVGLQSYPEIEEVPDEQVRQLIRSSVTEWEESLGE